FFKNFCRRIDAHSVFSTYCLNEVQSTTVARYRNENNHLSKSYRKSKVSAGILTENHTVKEGETLSTNKPEITVLMAVHKVHAHIHEAIDSILQQTYTNFVFLIVDDGSTDETARILKKYQEKDPRVQVHRCQNNQGLGYALCEGVKLAQTEFIARMDDDDIA